MPSVLVVADDLIWSTRVVSQATAAGGVGRSVRNDVRLREALASAPPDVVVVDLSGRAFDPLAAVRIAAASTVAIAIAPHEDHALRKSALEAGARRVYAYRKMHADGVAILGEWLAVAAGLGPPAAVATPAR